jgi:glycosyltransferase involved in cell wall biosynthesis
MTESSESGAPALSIILPTYNREHLLQACIQSCAQLGALAEIIVVDDCSSDGTRDVAESMKTELAARGCRALLLSTPANSGAPACRNLGIVHSQGDYILFLDSDDVINPDGIKTALDLLTQRTDCDFVYGNVQRVDERLQPIHGEIIGRQCTLGDEDVAGYHWHTMGILYRKSFLDRLGPWNEELTGSQDWEFQARAKLTANNALYLDAIFGYWRQHGSRRIGTRTFRQDYVESVLLACRSVQSTARRKQRFSRPLANSLAKRILIHGLELASFGFVNEGRREFDQIREMDEVSRSIRVLSLVLAYAPRFFLKILFRIGAWRNVAKAAWCRTCAIRASTGSGVRAIRRQPTRNMTNWN